MRLNIYYNFFSPPGLKPGNSRGQDEYLYETWYIEEEIRTKEIEEELIYEWKWGVAEREVEEVKKNKKRSLKDIIIWRIEGRWDKERFDKNNHRRERERE